MPRELKSGANVEPVEQTTDALDVLTALLRRLERFERKIDALTRHVMMVDMQVVALGKVLKERNTPARAMTPARAPTPEQPTEDDDGDNGEDDDE